MSDINHMLIEDAAGFDRQAFMKRQATPLEDDEIELVIADIQTTTAKLNRLCNLMLNRPMGLNIHALQCLEHIKVDVSWLNWNIRTQRLPADASPTG